MLPVHYVLSLSDVTVYKKKLFGSCTIYNVYNICNRSHDSSVGIALGYELGDQDSRIRFPAVAGNFSLCHCVQNGSGTHSVSYPMGTRGCSPGGKATGA
jgi:hypothetical protein